MKKCEGIRVRVARWAVQRGECPFGGRHGRSGFDLRAPIPIDKIIQRHALRYFCGRYGSCPASLCASSYLDQISFNLGVLAGPEKPQTLA